MANTSHDMRSSSAVKAPNGRSARRAFSAAALHQHDARGNRRQAEDVAGVESFT